MTTPKSVLLSTKPKPPPSDLFSDSLLLREKCVRDGSSHLTVLDYNLSNCLLYSQGSWSLIRADLLAAGVSEEAVQSLLEDDGPCKAIQVAFDVRREIIHYKKVCLHLFEETRRIERELQQCMAYLFWCDPPNETCQRDGIRAHFMALVEHFDDDEMEDDGLGDRLLSIDLTESRCSLLDRKRLYVASSRAYTKHRGLSRALHDARDIAKFICMVPRHPDGVRPKRLVDMPDSLYVHQIWKSAVADDPTRARYYQKKKKTKGSEESLKDGNDEKSNTSVPLDTPGKKSFDEVLVRTSTELNWPLEAVDFLGKCIIARGGYKALAIVEELQRYNKFLSALPPALEKAIQTNKSVHHEGAQKLEDKEKTTTHIITQDDLSAAVQRDRNLHLLKGALQGCAENALWINVLTQLTTNHPAKQQVTTSATAQPSSSSHRLFVARDDNLSSQACAFVPKGFQLGSFVSASRCVLDTVLLPSMRTSIELESWPPKLGCSRRTRVRAYDSSVSSSTINEITGVTEKKNKVKFLKCNKCHGSFDLMWIRFGLCSVCEARERQLGSNNDKCIFNCKLGKKVYCPHHKRCFVCESPHSCEDKCRLTRGNGEMASALIETLRPSLLMLDFDRTLASTKSGASPLPHRRSKKSMESSHTVDSELKTAVLSQQSFGSAHVITRNSNKEDIEEFLKMHGLSKLADNVHVVPKRMAKGTYIREYFYEHNQSCIIDDDKHLDCDNILSTEKKQTCLFIDDDIRELVADEWLREEPNVHRLLFVRGLL